jgi:hypothetical protein
MSYPIFVQGRRIYVRTGSRTQTVNVCTSDNEAGSYEVVYRLHGLRVQLEQVRACMSLADLETWLRALGAVDEGPRQPDVPTRMPSAPAPPAVYFGTSATLVSSTVPGNARPFTSRRVLVLGHSYVVAALVRERVVALGGEVAMKLTQRVTDVICLPDVRSDDVRVLRASSWGLPVLSMADLALLESGLATPTDRTAEAKTPVGS